MSFPHYPEYKDSGVEWLGEVPKHWEVVRLKNLLQRRITDGPHTTPAFVDDGVPFLSVDGIQDGELKFEGCRYISQTDHEEYRRKASPQLNDLLMGKAASTGKIARVKVDFEFSIWSPLALIRLDQLVANPCFYEHSLKSPVVQAQIDNLCTANTQKNISMDDIPKLILTRPPVSEQIQIAAFLDRETAKIDALVAEQQRLMELLNEKRQAVISHAVARGLSPNASMKPSGIEWLGDVPEHWDVSKMKWIAEMQSGHTPDKKIPAYWENGTISWVSLNDTSYLKDHDYISETAYSITQLGIENSSARLLPAGVVVFSRDATIGRCAITTKPMAVSQHFIAWVCGEAMIPEYLLLRLRSMTGELDRLTTGATLKTIGMPDVRTLVTPVPPLQEQKAIIAYVTAQTVQLDTLTTEAQRAITLLQERRTSLISAAVTGQIDVRSLS